MQGAGVVDVNGQRGYLEDVVFKAHQFLIRPHAKAAVFGQAVAADTGAGEDHVGVRGANFDGLDHFDQVNAVAFGEQAPFVEEGQDGGSV